jgi:phosphate/sulfate permease
MDKVLYCILAAFLYGFISRWCQRKKQTSDSFWFRELKDVAKVEKSQKMKRIHVEQSKQNIAYNKTEQPSREYIEALADLENEKKKRELSKHKTDKNMKLDNKLRYNFFVNFIFWAIAFGVVPALIVAPMAIISLVSVCRKVREDELSQETAALNIFAYAAGAGVMIGIDVIYTLSTTSRDVTEIGGLFLVYTCVIFFVAFVFMMNLNSIVDNKKLRQSVRLRQASRVKKDVVAKTATSHVGNDSSHEVKVVKIKHNTSSSLDDLEKTYELYKKGIITQNEFEEKKRQTLDL